MKSITVSALAILLLAACTTPYQPTGLTGGFETTQVGPNSYVVTFRAYGYTSVERAINFTLLQAADVTLQHGGRYFVSFAGVQVNGGLAPMETMQFTAYRSRPNSPGTVYDAWLVHNNVVAKYQLEDPVAVPAGQMADVQPTAARPAQVAATPHLQWLHCGPQGAWCPFETVDLTRIAGGGLYVVWHDGHPGRIVYIGQNDNLARGLAAARMNAAITAYRAYGTLRVTWAHLPPESCDAAQRYLIDKWHPQVTDRLLAAAPLAVNSPWEAK